MAQLDLQKILADSLAAAKNEIGSAWNDAKPYAEHEFKQFAESAEFLAKLKLTGGITDEELNSRLEIQRLALKNVLLTIEGIGLLTAQRVVNAVIGIVSEAIKTALNITLPI